jgi:hypothetical protein
MGRLERMKRGNGIKDRDDRSRGIEIIMTDVFDKINPTEPLRCFFQDYVIPYLNITPFLTSRWLILLFTLYDPLNQEEHQRLKRLKSFLEKKRR